MEDYEIDIMIGQGPRARSVKLGLQPFTLIGARTRTGLLRSPLRARFGIVHRLDYYTDQDIGEIVRRSGRIMNTPIEPARADEVARRAPRPPRAAHRRR